MEHIKKIVAGSALAVAGILGLSSLKTINAGEGGVRTTFGKVSTQETLDEGLKFRIPLIQKIHTFNVRTKKASGKTQAFSKDTQKVDVDYAVNYNLDRTRLPEMYAQLGNETAIEQNILAPAIYANMKNCIAQYNAEQLVASREKCALEILNALAKEMVKSGIKVTAVQIEDLGFEDTFEKSVEAKVVAAQDALRAANKTQQVAEEAKQKVIMAQAQAEEKKIMAQAESEAAVMLGKALKENPAVLIKAGIDKWNGEMPKVISSGQSNVLFDITRLMKENQKTKE